MNDTHARLRFLLGGCAFLALPTLLACGEKEKKPETLPSSAIVMAPDAAPVVVTPPDGGADAEIEADSGRKPVTLNTNVARLRLCCGQLHAQGHPIRTTPDGLVILRAASQCDGMVAQAGASSVPELGVLKATMGNRIIPPLCKGF